MLVWTITRNLQFKKEYGIISQKEITKKARAGGKMQSLLQETQFLMNKYQIKANNALGLNFLIKEEIV